MVATYAGWAVWGLCAALAATWALTWRAYARAGRAYALPLGAQTALWALLLVLFLVQPWPKLHLLWCFPLAWFLGLFIPMFLAGARVSGAAHSLPHHTSQVHEAVTRADADEVRMLCAEGADVNAKDPQGRTPLVCACLNLGIMDDLTNRSLTKHGKGPVQNLRPAYIDIVKSLIDHGADVNARAANGLTALRLVALNGDAEATALLIQRGVDLREDGGAAVLVAADGDHTEVVRLLAENGADVTLSADDGVTALMHMAHGGHADIVKLLIDRGADVNARRNDGATALEFAAQEGHAETSSLLRAHGAA